MFILFHLLSSVSLLLSSSWRYFCSCLFSEMISESPYRVALTSWLCFTGKCHSNRDGLGQIDNRPSTNKLHHFVRKKKEKKKEEKEEENKRKKWHETHGKWHVTSDIGHMPWDMWHVTICGGWTFSQNSSSLAFTVCVFDILQIWRKNVT